MINKSILLSIRPQHGCNVMNGVKEWELRKQDIKPGTIVYMYITKSDIKLIMPFEHDVFPMDEASSFYLGKKLLEEDIELNGKVVGKFVVDRTMAIDTKDNYTFISKLVSITLEEAEAYCKDVFRVYAWHVSQLEIFDKPKELGEFSKPCNFVGCEKKISCFECDRYSIKKAPQSFVYVEE